jgi:hypothetical protein
MVMRGGKSGSDDNRASASIRSRLLMFETKEGQKVVAACIEFGGWHHRDKTLMPIHLSALLTMPGNPGLVWAMDSLAAAAEAGLLDGDRYIEQLFATREEVRSFRQILRDAGGDRWLNAALHSSQETRLRRVGRSDLRERREPLRPSRVILLNAASVAHQFGSC